MWAEINHATHVLGELKRAEMQKLADVVIY